MNSLFYEVIISILSDIFEGKFRYKATPLEELLVEPSDLFKDANELKIFIHGIKWAI